MDRDPTGSETPRMHGSTARVTREVPGSPARPVGDGAQREVRGSTPLMHGPGKSDSPIVPTNVLNNIPEGVAEGREGRGLAERNPPPATTLRTQGRVRVQEALGRIRRAAQREKGARFTALLHHIYAIDTLRAAYFQLKRDAAPGVDGQTWAHYGEGLEERLADLSDRVRRGAYRPQPVRRAYVPKRDGQQRPIGVMALEDKIVQRATAAVLGAIYEPLFAGFSYGARPGRSAHQALAALDNGLWVKRVNWVLDADLRDFFGSMDQAWLIRFVEHRIGDRRVVRLIQQWLAAGVLEDGTWTQKERGTEQGGSLSPLLANLYLHYVFDLWAQRWRTTKAHGPMLVVRYLDDVIVGFQERHDADRFLLVVQERLERFGLRLHPDKTRLLEFGRYAATNRQRRGQRKPETFQFLGFVHSCGRTRAGAYTVRRHTAPSRLRDKLHAVKAELRRREHHPVPEVGDWLGSVVRGHLQYYGIAGNAHAIKRFRDEVNRLWRRALARRSQKGQVNWERMRRLIRRWIPPARIVHPYPSVQVAVMTQGRSPVR